MQFFYIIIVLEIQGSVSFSDMGIRPVNRLKVMQYRMVQGWCMCVNQHTLLSATKGAELITLYKCSIILSVLETILRPDHSCFQSDKTQLTFLASRPAFGYLQQKKAGTSE